MNIGQVASQTGLDSKTIRYYESIGLVSEPPRLANGYRDYDDEHIRQLVFLRQARQFGFSIEECRSLLELWINPQRRSAEVHELVADKVKDIDQHMRELRAMKKLLVDLMGQCADDENADCAIIDHLAGEKSRNKHL